MSDNERQPQRCETLFRRIIDRTGDASSDANELLKCFARGYSLENLRELLRSDDAEVAKSGVWIASELGAGAKPLLEDIAPILQSSISYARFFAIDAILTCAGPEDGPTIARAIDLVADPDAGVRWKAVQFVSRATVEQLAAAADFVDAEIKPGVVALAHHGETESLLASASPSLRKLGLAAAIREMQTNRAPIDAAVTSADEEISTWASEALEGI